MGATKYTKEFKLDAISLVLEQNYTQSEAAQSLGIDSRLISRWIKEHSKEEGQAFRGNGKLTDEQLEIRRLREELRRVTMEKEILKKATAFFAKRNEVKYSFIAQNKKAWPIDVMCQLLGVTRSGFYNYLKCNKPPDPLHVEMLDWVKKLAESSHYTYGSRRMKKALNALGYPVGRNKARNLMKEAGIHARYRKKYRVTTNSKHKQPIFENVLNRQFIVEKPNQAYASDITYIWTQEGWLYLAVVIDLFSRKVIGWSMSSRMKASLACDALKMALWQRKPNTGVITHSDRGVQYASNAYRMLLTTYGCIGSMSRKGNCWDNAVAESFFGRLKQERVQWRNYQTRFEAQQDILNYITMFYNSNRLHSFLGYKSPNQFENEQIIQLKKSLNWCVSICLTTSAAYNARIAPLNAVEGFIRQILGWREYIRGVYWYFMPDYSKRNSLNATTPLPEFYWTAETKMFCMGEAIRQTRDHAYSHHIQRLMITGNFALITGLNVKQVQEWYLAVYSDAYEWVEMPNTLGMALFSDGGVVASKPYAASGKYINRMSNYCQKCVYDPEVMIGEKACPFNALYWDFLARHDDTFRGNQRMNYVYSTWDKFGQEKQKSIREQAAVSLQKMEENKL